MTKKRNRFKQTLSLDERLQKTAEEYRAKAAMLGGKARDELLEKAREFEAQVSMNKLFS